MSNAKDHDHDDNEILKLEVIGSNIGSAQRTTSADMHSPKLLPPITKNGDTGDRCTPVPWKLSSPDQSSWSRYHSGCTVRSSAYMDWNSTRVIKSPRDNHSYRKEMHRDLALTTAKGSSYTDLIRYLDQHRELLETYALERIPLNTMENWIVRKFRKLMGRPRREPFPRSLFPFDYRTHFLDIMKEMDTHQNEHILIWKLAKLLYYSTAANMYRMYKLYPTIPDHIEYFEQDGLPEGFYGESCPTNLMKADEINMELIKKVVAKGATMYIARKESERFPEAPPKLGLKFGVSDTTRVDNVMYVPLLNDKGAVIYVVQLWRIGIPYTMEDEDRSSCVTTWGNLALLYYNRFKHEILRDPVSDHLLTVVRSIFENMASLDEVIKKILEMAQHIVEADRASLFLVDSRNSELVSTVFDLKYEQSSSADVLKREIRIPITRGIAGAVATSGKTMSIADAYSDKRFNKAVDEATGYRTETILCMPITIQNKTIGVVQLVNKRTKLKFNKEDEKLFARFSPFFGLALHHAKLYDTIMRQQQQLKIALDVLSYHNTCKDKEVQMLRKMKSSNLKLDNFYIDPFVIDEMQKCKAIIEMFDDLFDLSNFDVTTVMRFVLTVRKNYRDVPYHNFVHGWSVAHAMYVIIKRDEKNRFNYKMRLALFVASLCHDLDHRGYTNKYMSETSSPLAAMYSTSTLEHHHFNITVTILQQDGHHIFSKLSAEDYKEVLAYIRYSILATDLANFFPNVQRMKMLLTTTDEDNLATFSWSVPQHRDLSMAISMTAADLSASAKPWDVQLKTVDVIFAEFYDQGDKEKEKGITPIPMMDRNRLEEQPSSQVDFLTQICLPCYETLYRVLPKTKPMYLMAKRNLELWKQRAEHARNALVNPGPSTSQCSKVECNTTEVEKHITIKKPEENQEFKTTFDIWEENEDELRANDKLLDSNMWRATTVKKESPEDDEDVIIGFLDL